MSSTDASAGAASSVNDAKVGGEGDHLVAEGDCIHRIANDSGCSPDALWDHPANAELKRARPDRSVLLRGDKVFVPDVVTREEFGETDRRHDFVRDGCRIKIRLRFIEDDEPVEGARCIFDIAGERSEKRTNADGVVEVEAPAAVDAGTVTVCSGDRQRTYRLRIGSLDYHASPMGILQRLRNFGYYRGDLVAEWNQRAVAALHAFQRASGLEQTDEPDQATIDKLRESYGY